MYYRLVVEVLFRRTNELRDSDSIDKDLSMDTRRSHDRMRYDLLIADLRIINLLRIDGANRSCRPLFQLQSEDKSKWARVTQSSVVS